MAGVTHDGRCQWCRVPSFRWRCVVCEVTALWIEEAHGPAARSPVGDDARQRRLEEYEARAEAKQDLFGEA